MRSGTVGGLALLAVFACGRALAQEHSPRRAFEPPGFHPAYIEAG